MCDINLEPSFPSGGQLFDRKKAFQGQCGVVGGAGVALAQYEPISLTPIWVLRPDIKNVRVEHREMSAMDSAPPMCEAFARETIVRASARDNFARCSLESLT
jgi:hypothetical protein